MSDIVSVDALLKDMFPLPGMPLKQWVVDLRREAAWERETCPRLTPDDHEDNTGITCRNAQMFVPWTFLEHDCCEFCNDLYERHRDAPMVQTWLAEDE